MPTLSHSVDSAVTAARPAPRSPRRAFLPLFVLGSFGVHGIAYVALASGALSPRQHAQAPCEVAFEVAPAAPAPPALEEVAVPAAPAPPPPARPARERAAPEKAVTPTAPTVEPGAHDDAPEPSVTAAEAGDAPESAGAGAVVAGVPGGTSRGGTGSGIGTSSGDAGGTAAIDLRRLTSEWASRVSSTIRERAAHDYPRSAMRANVQGTVLLTVRIGTRGQIEAVELARSSGYPQLDEAALTAARGLGAVPPPPQALHRYLRPFPVPVSYVIRG